MASGERCFITDFGLAKNVRTGSKFTRTGQTLGTPSYMSPEVARGEVHALTSASDVWALGCLLYELCAGQRAFRGQTAAEIVGAILTERPPSVRSIAPAVSAECETLIDVCLTRDVGRRHPDAAALRDECDRLLAGRGLTRRAPRSATAWWVAAAACVVAAAAGLVVVLQPGRTAVAPPLTPTAIAEARALAARAWRLGRTDPAGAATLMARAVQLQPDRQDWRLRLGRLHWAADDIPAAIAIWAGVPPTAVESDRAQLYRIMADAQHVTDRQRTVSPETGALRRALSRRQDAIGRLARAQGAQTPAPALVELAGLTGWEAAMLSAYWLEKVGRHAESRAAADLAIAEGVPIPFLYAIRAAAQTGLGDLAAAERDFRIAVARAPRNAVYRTNLGYVRYRQDDVEGALVHYAAALELDATHIPSLVNRASAFSDLRRWKAAFDDVARALEIDPTSLLALEARASTCVDVGRFAEALRDLNTVLARAPNLRSARLVRAQAYIGLEQWAEAEADCRHLLTVHIDDVKILNVLGQTLLWQGRFDEAFAVQGQALDIEPDNVVARVERANIALVQRQWDVALAEAERACAVAPKQSPPHHARGLALMKLGRLPESLEAFSLAITCDPKNLKSRYFRGMVHLNVDQRAEGYADLTACLDADPADGPARKARGVAYQKDRDWPKATADFRAFLKAGHDDPVVHHDLAACLARDRRWDEAIVAAERGLARNPPANFVQSLRKILRVCRARRGGR